MLMQNDPNNFHTSKCFQLENNKLDTSLVSFLGTPISSYL